MIDATAAGFGTNSSLQSGHDLYLGGQGVDLVTANGADDVVPGGAGSDNVTLLTSQTDTTVIGSYDGGTGDDVIFVEDRLADVGMQLDKQVVVDGIVIADITGFNTGGVSAHRVTLKGSDGDDTLYASGMRHPHQRGWRRRQGHCPNRRAGPPATMRPRHSVGRWVWGRQPRRPDWERPALRQCG
ncbi:hypothetical protein LP418_09085 [Nocardioides sp. B-3]|nr:hypothetical protein LP418_09085 [Nocardioides sp. B-3]